MSLLSGAQGSINSAKATLKNPFNKKVENTVRDDDFIDGFQFEELGGPKKKVKLNGNLMPHVPFSFGGEQNIKKDFYAGQTEPSVQVLGPREKDLVIKGRFFDKRYSDTDLYGVATEIQQLCDSIRIRGNVCRIWMGEFQRYGIVKDTDFNLKSLSDIEYTITFDIIGFNAPINGKFIEKKKEVPFQINNKLIALANELQDLSDIPTSVPQSIADKINELTSTVAGAINLVTDFVDTVISVTNDIRKAVERVKGLIKNVQNKLRQYKNFLSSIDPFDSSQAVSGRYENASFYSGSFNFASFINSFLQRFKKQFTDLTDALPIATHTVKEGESLQKISIIYYDDATQWKNIYDHNKLKTTEIESGTELEIPEL